MSHHIPAREVPKTGILQDVRWFIRTELQKGKGLDEIQAILEVIYPGKDFDMFGPGTAMASSSGAPLTTDEVFIITANGKGGGV